MAEQPAWAIPKMEEIVVRAEKDGSITIEQYDSAMQETSTINLWPEHVESIKNFLDFCVEAIEKGEHRNEATPS